METAQEKSALDLSAFPVAEVGRSVLARYPVLENLPSRFEELGRRYGVDAERVLSLFLMGLEASALTAAMLTLKVAGVVALPVHDSLIVPQDAVPMAEQALMAAFQQQVGITPALRTTPAPGIRL